MSTPARFRARGAIVVLLAVLGARPGQADAQTSPDSTAGAAVVASCRAEAAAASPFVPPGHWAWNAARRLDALGLAPAGFDRGRSLRTRAELAALFQYADSAASDRTDLLQTIRGYADRFREELGNAGCPEASPVTLAIGAGQWRHAGRIGTGVGYFANDWKLTPIPDTSTAFGAMELGWSPGRHLALRAEPVVQRGGVNLRGGEAVAAFGAIGLWAGRRAVAFGPGDEGGIVSSGQVLLDGFGGFLARPIHFPWVLRGMGPIQIESFFSKTYGGDRIRDPYFVAFRGTMTPHPRLTVGLNRAAMFAGRGNEPITLKNMLFLLRGGVGNTASGSTGQFANDVLSVDVAYRAPTERTLPLVTYIEWGMDDAAGMWHRSPGIVAGLRTPAVPGLTGLGLGLQTVRFVRSTPQNTMWYRNWSLRQGWADYGIPVGQSLAGEGREFAATAEADLARGRLQVIARGFTRKRGDQNLYAPDRQGVANGGSIRLDGRIRRHLAARLDGEVERGADWTVSRVESSLRWSR